MVLVLQCKLFWKIWQKTAGIETQRQLFQESVVSNITIVYGGRTQPS